MLPFVSSRAAAPAAAGAARFPNTSNGIHVFDDQLSDPLTPGQLRFAATHYAGSQKERRSEVDALHRINPRFVVLQYRLGIALGYRASTSGCNRQGDWLRIIDGDRWIREWPPNVDERWFYHRNGSREYLCQWGWYLADPSHRAWRTWWFGRVVRQIADTHADGAFLDSVSVPNYLAYGNAWDPPLPGVDATFEQSWVTRIDHWLPYVTKHLAPKPVIVNAGSWVNSRDRTDYSGATGVMIEGCAEPGEGSPLAPSDWRLQMDRTLSEVRLGKVVICQSYPNPSDVQMRMFVLGSYLLFKGTHTFVNLEIGFDPEWFPEYAIRLGKAATAPPRKIETLAAQGVYVRRYANGIVVVNPGDTTKTYRLARRMFLVTPHGGGTVPSNGSIPSSWGLSRKRVGSVTLQPQSAAVLLAS